jgi:hypothetical protein
LALASQLAIVADAACGFNFYGSSLVKKEEEAGSVAGFEKFERTLPCIAHSSASSARRASDHFPLVCELTLI